MYRCRHPVCMYVCLSVFRGLWIIPLNLCQHIPARPRKNSIWLFIPGTGTCFGSICAACFLFVTFNFYSWPSIPELSSAWSVNEPFEYWHQIEMADNVSRINITYFIHLNISFFINWANEGWMPPHLTDVALGDVAVMCLDMTLKLIAVRQQANVYPDLCCHMTSLGHNELS